MMPESPNTAQDDATAAANMRSLYAAKLFEQVPQIAEDMQARPRDETSPAFLKALLRGETPEEAVTFAAYALVPRYAVWWAHECLQAMSDHLTDEDRAMLGLCATWAADPDEPNRYAALDAGLGAEETGPGAWIAIAAGWSSGSMAPPDSLDVPVQPFMCARAVNGGVLSGLARVPLDQRRRKLAHFISMAEVLARSA
jgi:hypothetical protein